MSGRLRKGFGASMGTPRFIIPAIVVVLIIAFLAWFIGRS